MYGRSLIAAERLPQPTSSTPVLRPEALTAEEVEDPSAFVGPVAAGGEAVPGQLRVARDHRPVRGARLAAHRLARGGGGETAIFAERRIHRAVV